MRALFSVVLLVAATDTPSFDVPVELQQLLDGGKWDATPASFRLIVLSNLADGCVGQAKAKPGLQEDARRCVEAALTRALPLGRSPNGLHLTHLNLIYGAVDQLGPCADARAHEALARELARRSLEDPLRHAASYERVGLRWPADQSATLASLARFDAAHGTHLVDAPLAQWARVMERHLDAKTGLPESEVTGRGPGAKHPRGCAQSFITKYLAEVDPALSAKWWESYREHFFVRVGPVVGFREWPRGVERKADVDSGPIVFGIGTAASAFALAAARAQGDVALAAELEANASVAISSGIGGDAARSVLAQAIAFQGRWQPALVRLDGGQ